MEAAGEKPEKDLDPYDVVMEGSIWNIGLEDGLYKLQITNYKTFIRESWLIHHSMYFKQHNKKTR